MKKIFTFVTVLFLGVSLWGQDFSRHPWAGARVAFIGDSITDPNLFEGEVVKYWEFMGEWMSITPLVYGRNGRQWNEVVAAAEAVYSDHGNNLDAIFVFMGTNDFNAGLPVGEWFTEEEVEVVAANGQGDGMQIRGKRTPVMDQSTFKGRINLGVSCLKRLFPDKQIVLLPPIHRAYAKFGEGNVQPDENYRNSCGEFVDAYVQAVKEAGNVWSVSVVDINALSGLNPMLEEHLKYFHNPETDRLHPNTEGHRRIAKTLQAQCMALPIF